MDARQILTQIRADPDLADEVRRALLTDQLLAVPQAMVELAERQTNLEVGLQALTQALAELTERVARVETQFFQINEAFIRLTGVVANMRGDLLELRYSRHAAAYLAALVSRPRVMAPEALGSLAEDGRDAGTLSDAETDDLVFADLVVEGRDRETREPLRLVVEVSGFVELPDVERAHRRASLLARASPDWPVRAVVAGDGVEASVGRRARELDVAVILDGRSGR